MAVAITGASGTLSHGSSLTITGSGFGTKSPAAPWFWDTIENQTAYVGLADNATIPTGGANPWETSHGWNVEHPILYSTSRTMRRSGKTAMYTSAAAERGGVLGGKHIGASTWYMSYWWRPSADWMPDGSSNKILRLSDDAGLGQVEFSWTESQIYIYDGGYLGSLDDNWVNWGGTTGAWNRQEIDCTNRSSLKCSTNLALIRNHTTWSAASADLDGIYTLGLDWNTESGLTGFVLDIDEIYIDKTRARVEIGNASTFAACTQREIQPPTSWSDTSATVSVNTGSLTSLSTRYLYLIDSAGLVNSSGFLLNNVTSGGGGGSSPIVLGIRR